MSVRREDNGRKPDEVQRIGCSWIPATPAKPGSTERLAPTPTAQASPNGPADFEAKTQPSISLSNAGMPTNSHVYQESSWLAADEWANMSFGNLFLAMGNEEAVERGIANNVLHPQFEASMCQLTVSSGNSFQQTELGADGVRMANTVTDRSSLDLNAPPPATADAAPRNITPQFEPVTPEKISGGREYQQDHAMKHSSIEEATTTTTTRDGAMQQRGKKKKSHLVDDQTCEVASTKLQENHKPDLIKTPSQKTRRKRHRPKVIVEGQKKNTPKSSAKKVDAPKETPKVLRKYVRRNRVASPVEGGNNGADSDCKTPSSTGKQVGKSKNGTRGGSCKSGGMNKETTESAEIQASWPTGRSCRKSLNFNNIDEPVIDGISSELPSSNGERESQAENSNAEDQPQTPHSTQEKDMVNLRVYTRSKKKLREDSLSRAEQHPQSPKGTSIGSGRCLIPEKQMRGLKRKGTDQALEEAVCSRSGTGIMYDSLQAYLSGFTLSAENGTLGLQFPENCKKRRTKNGRQESQFWLAFQSAKGIRRRRSKGRIRRRNLASSRQGRKQKENSPGRAAAISITQQNIEVLNEPSPPCIEAPVPDPLSTVARKKRSERIMRINLRVLLAFADTSFGPPMVGSIIDRLSKLDLNADGGASEEQKALVPFQTSGDVVPFDQGRVRKKRAKVDLDEESMRVWTLLLENIDSEGIDGTSEETTKRWEEERRIFAGRADSFIARMHLVQGDRHFSPWKGSVVDSVVGVFLTQNVSDHLSSSAFMSLAAKYPAKRTIYSEDFHDERLGGAISEPVIWEPDSDDSSGLTKEALNETICGEDTIILHEFEDDSIREMNIMKPLQNASGDDSISCEIMANRSVSSNEDGKDIEGTLSSETPEISSQNSSDSPMAQTTGISDSCILSPAELELFPKSSKFSDSCSEKELCVSETNELSTESASGTTFQEPTVISCLFTSIACSSCNEQVELNQKKVDQAPAQNKNQGVPEKATNQQSLMDATGNSSNIDNSNNTPEKKVDGPKSKGGKISKEKENPVDWDELRKQAQLGGRKRERTYRTLDSVDWEAVRRADVNVIARIIKDRGMNNVLAGRIKDFLDRIVKDHGSIDLEWLRDAPPDKAKEYLLSIRGLGLKSVECVRLLTLHHLAFPVDTNVGRIAVRLGWVPLQPLPEFLQIHLLEEYPYMETIQKYLWPRLCKLDQKTLYELHYQMITFGKVFCTKSKPNCNACPMRAECRHFASAFASAKLALPAPQDKSIVTAFENSEAFQNPNQSMGNLQLPFAQTDEMGPKCGVSNYLPIVEEPQTPEPIIELAATPEHDYTTAECDIEDAFAKCDIEDASFGEDPDDIPTIHLNMAEFTHNVQTIMLQNMEQQDGEMSTALVALTSEAASIPMPKLKNVSKLRTEHRVYELPDSHPLLEGMDKRELDDPSPYLLAIWTPGETMDSITPPEKRCSYEGFEKLCTDETCSSCNSTREAKSQIVRGTILIPCRTAMRGSFPLNGTYFQVNEVFSDHESSLSPMNIPRHWLWNLRRRTVYFGTSIPSIFKGLSTEGIQYCFWRGFVCVRGFDRKTRAPRPLIARLHFSANKLAAKEKIDENNT